jgi:hypothetical protein
MRFVGIPPDYVFVTIVLHFVLEGSDVVDELITWVIMTAFLE